MTTDPETMATYARLAAEYAERISRDQPDGDLRAFMAALPPGDLPVLDWGCGPGNSAVLMQGENILVHATDASPEMAALASELGVAVRVEPFEALDAVAAYRGVWANFSLLHARVDVVPDLIARAARALVPGGVLHLGMKEGTGEARDPIGRLFSYWTADALERATVAGGLARVSVRHGTGKGLDGRVEPFVIHMSRRGPA